MVEISIARYEKLLAAERDAAILKRYIACKKADYREITHSELSMLKELFCSDNTEVEE